ncbi:MAG TPA: OmpA family protein [Gemmatimonadaceae bacterium]|nr:OmpA family protein [Gemmatimonadaceae bacterium]
MRKTLLTISLLSFAALTSACSRNRAATAPSTSTTASASNAALEAAQRESAKLQADANDSDAAAAEAAARSKTHAGDRAAITAPVYFQFDRSDITDDGMRMLDQKVDALQRNPNVQLRIEGNADDSGSDEYNLALSQRRAAIVSRYFTDRGIDASRLRIAAYGEERPACTATREEDCRSKNRRDEFVILTGF